jgi:PKD repeat protein
MGVLWLAPSTIAASLRAEYWVDSDPGFGNATAFAISEGASSCTVPTGALSEGYHMIGLRVKNNKNWSQTYLYMFFADAFDAPDISAAEYFLDDDPGLGKAKPIAVNPKSTSVAFSLQQMDTLSRGYHIIGMRAKRSGVWSQTYRRRFFNLDMNVAMNVEKVVAWWDDSEERINVPFTIQDGVAVIDNHILDASGLTYGLHTLYVRATADTRESATYSFEVCKNAVPQFTILDEESICVNQEVIILDESQDVQPETTFAWDMNGDGKAEYTEKGDFMHTFTKAGTYTVTLTVKTGDGCESVYSREIYVHPTSAPSVSLSRSKSKNCAGESVTFTANPTNGGENPSYTWYRNDNEIAGVKESQLTLDDLQNGDKIKVQLTTDNPCATVKTAMSSVLTQTVYDLPEIQFSFAAVYYTEDKAFSLSNMATPTGGTFYINDTEAKLFNPKANETGTYHVRYVVTNTNGCTAESETSFELRIKGDETALDETATPSSAIKILRNGTIYILRGDKVYTVTGQEVK